MTDKPVPPPPPPLPPGVPYTPAPPPPPAPEAPLIGRPPGSPNRVPKAVRDRINLSSVEIVDAVIASAKKGDAAAQKLLLDRLDPPKKGRNITFTMPALDTIDDVKAAYASLMSAVASGDVSPEEAAIVAKMLEGYSNTAAMAAELSELRERLDKIDGSNIRDVTPRTKTGDVLPFHPINRATIDGEDADQSA